MTDLTPGSRWLLPVRFSHSTPWQDRTILTVMPYGGNSSVVIPVEDPTSLIPADRITELEAEVAALKYALYMTIDPFAAGTEQAMELLGDYQPTEEHNKCP